MRCPRCLFDCPDGTYFCGACGNALEQICPECRRSNPLTFKFCGNCGRSLTLSAGQPVRDLSSFRRLVPEDLTRKALAHRDALAGERRQVTVMFCDMEGFTGLSERIGAEAAYALMDEIYEVLIRKVYDYEGTVNELTGDGIMAFFGAPIALEDAPQRAIRSALAIHRGIVRLGKSPERETPGVPPIRMRIGIHTGPVVVGSLGNDLRVEFKAVGDTVNLASRMEQLAEPGTTYVSGATFKLTEGLFRFEALGERRVKGRREPVAIYRVIAPSTSRTRFDVSAERGLTPLVGRERELELLIDAFERSQEGRGQAFSVVAEAGVGKSRLLYEFRKAVVHEHVTFLEGKCLSYSRGTAYHPVIDTLKSNFDVRSGDGHAEIRAKVDHGLEAIGVDLVATRPYILDLLSVKDADLDESSSGPELRKQRTFDALDQVVLRGAEVRPLILALEDVHWIDKSSEDYVKHLVASIPAARVLLVLTYRPEFAFAWSARSYYGQVNLNRLSNRESLAMVKHLLSTEHIDPGLEDLILEKTEGIPLFVEEFVRSLVDLKLVEKRNGRYCLAAGVRDLAIPSTIHDVIMARVDSLPEHAKTILKTGSVIEREFSHQLIKGVMELDEQQLLAGLSILKDAELLYERGIYPQSTYIFKHPLTREVVYKSILTAQQRTLHERVGKTIEELHADHLDEHYEILARHYTESGNYEKGAEFSERAAKKAHQAGSLPDAIEHAKRRVSCCEKLRVTNDVQRSIIDARTTLAGYYLVVTDLVHAKEAVAPILQPALESDCQDRLPGIYTALGLYHLWVDEDAAKGGEYLEEASRISEKTGGGVWLWFTFYYLGAYLSWNCAFEQALEYFTKALDISSAADHLPGVIMVKSTMALHDCYRGKIDLAYRTSSECLRMAREVDDPFAKMVTHSNHGVSCYFLGAFGEAEKTLLDGLGHYEKTTQAVYGCLMCSFLGDVYCELAEYRKALACYERGIESLERSGMLCSWIHILRISAARARALEGHKDIDLGELPKHYEGNRLKLWKGSTARNIAETLMAVDDQYLPDAESWLKRAIEVDTKNGPRWYLARDFALYAELCRRRSDPAGARDHLRRAAEIFNECGATGFAEKSERELAALAPA